VKLSVPFWLFAAILGVTCALSPLVACTPAARSVAGGVLTTLGPDVPIICSIIPGAQGQACSTSTVAVSDVAKLIGDILSSLPKADVKGLDMTPTTFALNGCIVTLPKWQADAVRSKLAAGGR
jgi:hypothetical protein